MVFIEVPAPIAAIFSFCQGLGEPDCRCSKTGDCMLLSIRWNSKVSVAAENVATGYRQPKKTKFPPASEQPPAGNIYCAETCKQWQWSCWRTVQPDAGKRAALETRPQERSGWECVEHLTTCKLCWFYQENIELFHFQCVSVCVQIDCEGFGRRHCPQKRQRRHHVEAL